MRIGDRRRPAAFMNQQPVRRLGTERGRVAAPPATPRHPNHSLPLLPSGPGGVCKLSSRGNRRGHRRLSTRARNRGVRNYCKTGGEGGIRTRETGISRLHTFQACSFNHSDTSPHSKNRVCVRCAGAEDTRGAQWVQAKRIAPRLRQRAAQIAACCVHERRLSGGHGALATMNLSSANPPCRIRP